ncbi:MAG: SusC/RagA family TonB-linked outer membrane protein [Flavobacteriaceae bacterium]|nr:SusC/RagA family TonB-linked outer membrane protein [Flavobacteriaceae bacterium]
MRNFKSIFLSILMLLPFAMFAQQTVKGKVIEKSTGQPLPGVNIVVKGTLNGTTTDFDGAFSLSVKDENAVLVFSFLGFKTQEVSASSGFITISLEDDAQALNEVVVIGYGSVKKEDLTGSVDLITSKDFNKGPVVSPQQLISGKIAGVSVTSGSGAPGDGQEIIIRGVGSLSLDRTPLIVVDGIPLNNGGVGGSRNPLNLINPNDIESMVVLKDASATAIYGSRAANGVILITTKKGKDTEFRFNFNSSATVSSTHDRVDVLTATQFTDLVTRVGDADAIGRLGSANTNWQNLIYTTAVGTDNSFSALGSAFGVPMRFSIGNSNQEGVLKGDNFNRTTASLNFSPSLLDDHLRIELNARGMYTENAFANRGAIGAAVGFDPTQSVNDSNSGARFANLFTWVDSDGYQLNLAGTNPIALLNLVDDTAEVRRVIANAKFDYDLPFLPNLTATVNVGYDKSNSRGRTVTSKFMPTSDTTFPGSRNTFTQEATSNLLDTYLTYKKTFNDVHDLTVVGGYSYQSFEFNNFNSDSEKQRAGNVYEFIDKSKNVLLSYFGRLNYGYKGKYLITATVRADASSKLNPKDRWGYFPSVAFAWNIDKEDFFKSENIDELKLRIGYGEVGNVNGLGDYKFLTSYTGSQSTANYQFGTGFLQTFRPEPVNENLKWEVGRTYNIGLDYSFYNRRISGSINAYIKQTNNLIAEAFIDPFTNFGNKISKNIGDMENKGVEFSVSVVPVKTDNFKWTLNYNVAFNGNTVTKLPFVQQVGGISGGVGNNIQTHTKGESPFSFLVYQQVYDSAGNPIEGAYVDRNGDNIINDNDRYIYHDPYANVIMGFNTHLEYKNWDLDVVTRANIGNYVYNNVASSTGYLRRATDNGILTNLHASSLVNGFVNTTEKNLLSSHFISNASFFKIDNITMGYRLKNKGDITARFYGSIQNVATITNYKGLDPEISGGIDNNFYPRPSTFVLGVNIDF